MVDQQPEEVDGQPEESSTPPEFFTGKEALEAVGQVNGVWNWCLIGPDPDKLPLSAGGCGGVESIKEVLGVHAVQFGLMRLQFVERTGSERADRGNFVCKWVCLQISNLESDQYTAVDRGKAMSKLDKMQEAFTKRAQVNIAVTVQVTCPEDCNLQWLLDQMQYKVRGENASLINQDSYKSAWQEYLRFLKVDHKKEQVQQQENEVVHRKLEQGSQLQSEEAEPEEPRQNTDSQEQLTVKQRKPLKLFKKGENVKVYSNQTKIWHDDGVIVEAIDEAGKRDGFPLPAGSMKAQYNNGRRYKWVTPLQAKEFLLPSTRPVSPPALTGELYKETHNFITEWHIRHFELNKGFLQWWETYDDACNGLRPKGVVSLLGLQIRVMDTVFSMRTASTKGVIYSFDATTKEGVEKWTDNLNKHGEYCEKMRQHVNANVWKEEEAGQLGLADPIDAVLAAGPSDVQLC